jgi:hypothetical protein
MSIRHRLAHWFGWQVGRVDTWWEADRLMVGFRCGVCGALAGVHESVTERRRLTAQEIADDL